jgi:hypothetical protein
VEKEFPMPSLIPYLKSGIYTENSREQKIRLVLNVNPDKKTGSNFAPFFTISDSDPISKIFEAQFVTDSGSLIKKVFLLIQKDQYALRSEDIWPINNLDIERCWQKAYKTYCGSDSQNRSGIVFKEQIGENDCLLPFKPLFFCMKTAHFFHPLCPACGIPLQQCHDDVLLIKSGLGAYSSSLSRYLYCKACTKEVAEPAFYVQSSGHNDPMTLKDMTDILTGYYRLIKGNKASDIPCQECEHFDECFERGDLAENRIVPFSFYPFYMMAFDAPTMNALDFLSLLSGSTREEISEILTQKQEMGRKRCIDALPEIKERLIFEKDDRLFYEILYLKLSFLGELARNLLGKIQGLEYPDLSLSMDRIWVKLSHENSMLPAFWNFNLVTIDIGGNISESTYLPRIPPFFGLYHLGVIWFYTLLVNKRQGAVQIYQKISESLKQWLDRDSNHYDGFLKDLKNPEFAPENIFWNPDKMAVFMPRIKNGGEEFSIGFQKLWAQTLEQGWHLLKTSLTQDSGWSIDDFHKQLDHLKHEAKAWLFRKDAMLSPKAVSTKSSDNRAISRVMFRLADKWQWQLDENGKQKDLGEITVTEESMNPATEDLDEHITETVIISGENDHGNHVVAIDSENHPISDKITDTEEDIPETVIMHADQLRVPFGDQDLRNIDDDDFLSETVILDAEKSGLPFRQPIEMATDKIEPKTDESDDFDEDELLKTVIIDPDTQKDKKR